MRVEDLLAIVARRSSYSFVAEAGLDDDKVSLDARGVSLDELLNMVGRRIGAEVHRAGNVYYLGKFRPEDRAVLVRRVRRLDAEEIGDAIDVLLSAEGRRRVFGDGLAVIGDKLQVLARVDALLNQVEAADAATWVVQYHLVALTDAAMRELGLDVQPGLEVAATFARASGTGGAASADLSASLDAVLQATNEDTDAELVIEHLSVVRDGVEESFFEGEDFPIVLFRTTEQGQQLQGEVEFIETGVRFRSRLREYSDTQARLAVNVELSELQGVLDNQAPQTSRTEISTETVVDNGGVYLLRSHRTGATRETRSRWLRLGRFDKSRERTLQLWVRCVRIGGPVRVESGDVGDGEGPHGQAETPRVTTQLKSISERTAESVSAHQANVGSHSDAYDSQALNLLTERDATFATSTEKRYETTTQNTPEVRQLDLTGGARPLDDANGRETRYQPVEARLPRD